MEQKIKYQIKKLAQDFDLKYHSDWFRYVWVPVRYEILIEYIGICPDTIYNKYGKNPEQRIKNICKFVGSKDFLVCLKRYGWQVIEKKELVQQGKSARQIMDRELRSELLSFYRILKGKFGDGFLALLTIPRNKKEKELQLISILRHEWIHILLYANKVIFQKIDKKCWVYDEGINEFMGAYLDGTLNKLEKFRDKENYPMEKKNLIYAIKLRESFKDKNTSSERRKVIFGLMSDLRRNKYLG